MAIITKDQAMTFQRLLNMQGADLQIDGKIGPLTKAAIEAFDNGLLYPAETPSTPSPEDSSIEIKTYPYTKDVIYGETCEEVKQLQAMLKYHGFGKYLGTCGIDGVFGYGTRKGLEEYVRGRGLNTPALEKTRYKTVTKEIWEMFFLKWYDIEGSIFTNEYTKCNCNGKWCDGHFDKYGVSLATVMITLRLEDEIKKEYGPNASLRLTDDYGKNAGSRCPNQNKEAGGADDSQHIKSRAFDLYVDDADGPVDYKYVQRTASDINPHGGCSKDYNSVVHVDSRGKWARW